MLNSISERDQRTLKMGGMLAGLIVAYMVVVSPLQANLEGVYKRLNDDNKKLADIKSSMAARLAAKQAADKLATQATIYPDKAALNHQTATMLEEVEKLPTYHLLTVKRLEGLPLRDDDDYYHSSVSLQFSSTLGNVHQFLKELEAAEPRLRVDRMNIAADAKDRTLVEGQMVVSAFAVVAQKGKSGS